MNSHFHKDIIARLFRDYQFKENGEWLQQGRCPSCGKKELFTRSDNPWVLRCGRQNRCGQEFQIKELYPDVFEDFNKRFEPSRDNPNATADAYMEYARGLDPVKMRGWYRQGKFWQQGAAKGTSTVLFDIDSQKNIYMERFVEDVMITDRDGNKKSRRANFHGGHRGLWWQPPGMAIERGDTVWLVEGCLDAISLNMHGIKAVATLSCGNYPAVRLEQHQDRNVTWVWALDNDRAGQRAIRKHVKKGRLEGLTVRAAQIPKKKGKKTDWNDCHRAGAIKDSFIEDCLYQGDLLIALTPIAKAMLIWGKTRSNGFDLVFNNRLYWFELDLEKYTKAQEIITDSDDSLSDDEVKDMAVEKSGTLQEIANCNPTFLYFQANTITDEAWYYCRIDFPHGGAAVKNTFTGSQLSSSSEFKKRLLSIAAGAVFTGAGKHLDKITKQHLYAIKTVDTIDFIGYSKEHQAYIFNDIAVSGGKVIGINDEDFYEIGKQSVKSLNQSVTLKIGETEDYTPEWADYLWQCFGPKGMVSVAFWLGSLFAEQIRGIHKSYPFLEVIGEPGAGKTTLVEFLWKLIGRQDYEGFDPSKSTAAARSRNFNQVSNLPVVLIEADRDEDTAKARKFDWDELKTAYNGRASRARGMKNSGNETYEPPFRGSIVITQNAEVMASEAILQRIIHLNFDRSAHTSETKNFAELLEGMPLDKVSHFLKMAVAQEKMVMELVKEKTPLYERGIMKRDKIKHMRIAKNHAQIMALVDALAKLINLTAEQVKEIRTCILDLAEQRQSAIGADHSVVQQFWEIIDYLGTPDGDLYLNHSKDENLIAINLNHFVKEATMNMQQFPLLNDLKRHLKTSRVRKFIDQKAVSSRIWQDKTVKCWVFKKEK